MRVSGLTPALPLRAGAGDDSDQERPADGTGGRLLGRFGRRLASLIEERFKNHGEGSLCEVRPTAGDAVSRDGTG